MMYYPNGLGIGRERSRIGALGGLDTDVVVAPASGESRVREHVDDSAGVGGACLARPSHGG
jgi:hypothetical protein